VKSLQKVGEQVPLKQGLKLMTFDLPGKEELVGEQVPLKQGLKLNCPFWSRTISLSRRAGSIKTRIETLGKQRRGNHVKVGEQVPLKQGLKHQFFFRRIEW